MLVHFLPSGKKALLISLTFVGCFLAKAQPYSSGEILQRLHQLNTLGSVLYIAAHPDDENTRLIAWLAGDQHLRTGYLAATRGDGGQNLIGTEIGERLGIIRTQELLAARRLDGGEQFFTRANDFGFSKDPSETFNIWDKEQVLADYVWIIRRFQPDVIITRFSQQPGITHGHHTASAVLAMEAFEKSGDPNAFPEQLKWVNPWQPAKIFWNIGRWGNPATDDELLASGYVRTDVGAYSPFLGKSFTEISAASRSMHKSQGFGDTPARGTAYEYFQQWDGEKTGDLLGGIDFTWGRVAGSKQVAYYLKEALTNFDPLEPTGILPQLLAARAELLKLPDQYWKEQKLKELEATIVGVSGLFVRSTASAHSFAVGDSIRLSLEVINRSQVPLHLSAVAFAPWDDRILFNLELANNQRNEFRFDYAISASMPITQPYWLEQPSGREGMYAVRQQELRGLPENPPAFTARVSLKLEGQFIDLEIPVVHRRTDPVRGEVIRPVVVTPPVMVNVDSKALIFGTANSRVVDVQVLAGKDRQEGTLALELPAGWRAQPATVPFSLAKKGQQQNFQFEIFPPSQASEGTLKAVATVAGRTYVNGMVEIDYEHIPVQTVFPTAETKVVRLDVQTVGTQVGYIMGAGDEVPAALEQMGYRVTLLGKEDINAANLRRFQAVLVGIRAFNTVDWLAQQNQTLFDYVEQGGNLIVQYNTSHQLVTQQLAPFRLQLSRDRVTVENSPVTMLQPNHPVLSTPNRIAQRDFEGWVQERGLYFPGQWDEAFQPVLEMNDPDEPARTGSLLVARHGQGYYCYTGLSFFRELPAGVPGAFRLLANMIALGQTNDPK